MKVIALLPIGLFILGCASNPQPPKAVRSPSSSELDVPVLSLQDSITPEAQAAIEQLRVGMSELEAFEIMKPVSPTWHRQPSYTEPGTAEVHFQVSPTQELLLYLSSWKVASIGPVVPAKPRVVYPAWGSFNNIE